MTTQGTRSDAERCDPAVALRVRLRDSKYTLASLALAVERTADMHRTDFARGVEMAGAMLSEAACALGPADAAPAPMQVGAVMGQLAHVDKLFALLRAVVFNFILLNRCRREHGRMAHPGLISALRRLLAALLATPAPALYRLGHPPATGPPPAAQRALSTSTLTAAPPPAPAATVLAGAAT